MKRMSQIVSELRAQVRIERMLKDINTYLLS